MSGILTSFDTPFLCLGNENEKGWHWNNIDIIQKNLKLSIQAIHGGILYFDKNNKNISKFYKDCKFALDNYDKLGFLRNFRNGMTDEIIFSWAMAKNNLKAINYEEFPIISFNINANIVFPFFGHCRQSIDFKECKNKNTLLLYSLLYS